MKIDRSLKRILTTELLESNKIVVLYGARQTGKTTLSDDVISGLDEKILKINADESRYIDVLSSRDFTKMQLLVSDYTLLFIDEAQRIPDVGINLKILHDNLPSMKMLVTGSSSFELANKVKEPLTGRTITHTLYPISLTELRQHFNVLDLQNRLGEFMIYGMYPALFRFKPGEQKEKYLRELASAYLYRDVLELSSIRNSSVINDLLKLLAMQIANEVSLNELAQNLKISQETVNVYISLLEKAFIIFRLKGFSRNLRKEISKRDKIYFWDLGVRNTLLNNFSPLSFRSDLGAMWENFVIAERLKFLAYHEIFVNSYFWRTYTGAEVDYVEEKDGNLTAFEIKFQKAKKKPPATWTEHYGNNFNSITRDNFWDFLFNE
ncbi:MAG: ATP-binding protein [Bacteroidetes bacterium]|nr:ATP-binding protein [Bacteroidota bacterium]